MKNNIIMNNTIFHYYKEGGIFMLSAKGLLESLSKEETCESYSDCNDDHDFGEVLDFFNNGNSTYIGHNIRYSDGQEKIFSFDD